ncbi:MAG: nucleotidyltransferase family protein [Candidatus Omnitrophica bacterium]|nr:nucleotidyltransferase family protein [Candidatus Omnitrophota bacterium]
MKPEARVVNYLIKEIVYGIFESSLRKVLTTSEIDYKRLTSLLIYNELMPFLYILLKNTPEIVNKNLFHSIKKTYYTKLYKYMILLQELLKILKEAKKKNILIIPIKGFSFSEEYYKRFGFRPLVDIDLLIKEKDFEKGVTLLENFGYREYLLGATEEYWKKEQCHLEFIKIIKAIPIVTELHWALDFKRFKKKCIPRLWERLRKINIDNEDFSALSPEDTLFSLALHQRRFGKVLNLKYVLDTGIMLKKEKLEWDYIVETAYQEKIRASLYFLLYHTQFTLNIDLRKYLDKLKIPYWQRILISKIIRKYSYSPPVSNLPYVYTMSHFLLYDNIIYPIKYILNIPQEQFAKFYSLPIYSPRTERLYKIRFLYIIYRLIKDNLKQFFKK